MKTKVSNTLLKEVAMRNLRASIDMLSVALERFNEENGPEAWEDLDETLKLAARDIKVIRLILN